MRKAFIIGKFMPFHRGHEGMISFALTKCDLLTVLVCRSDKEHMDGEIRKQWIEKSFEGQKNIEVRLFNYSESEFPNTSESSKEVSRIWASALSKQFPDYSLLVTSEPYGDYVAEFMGIEHIPFDMDRKIYPVSATAIRNNLFQYWKYLPDSVKPYFAIKVAILGTESTGKTVLTNKLAKHYGCNSVSEAGRDLIPTSNSFSISDLNIVANEHAKRIDKAILGNSPLTIIDTDIHITKSYSKFAFGTNIEISDKIYESNKADLYLYLNNDVAFFQDGTRLSEEKRNILDSYHRDVLSDHNINFVEIKGDWEIRLKKAIESINKLISKY